VKDFLFRTKAEKQIRAYKATQFANSKSKDIRKMKQLVKANIPREFWHISLDNFDGDPTAMRLVEKYCNDLKMAREKGFGFLFMGANGVGKTSLSIIIMKEAIKQGYTAFYITLPEIFKQIYAGWKDSVVLVELKKILFDTDFLAVGELGKDYHRKGSELFMVSEFDSLFRERRGDIKPMIMDTNLDEVDLAETYGQSIISLFKSRSKFITIKGDDYRKKKQEKEVESFFRKKGKK